MRGKALIVCALVGFAQAQPVRYDGHRAVRVQVRNLSDYRTALALTDDIWSHRVGIGGSIDMRVSPVQYATLIASGIPHQVLIPDVQARIELEAAEIARLNVAPVDGPGFFNVYHPYAEVKAYAQQLAAQHPAIVTYEVIGQSLEGRDIFALRITGVGNNGTRPQLLFNGGQHAREWVSVSTVMYIAEKLARGTSDPHTLSLLNNLEFLIVPIVNPDGYVYTWTDDRLWRKNRRDNGMGPGPCMGVDTNRNWGFQWGGQGASTTACNETYRGTAPFSEPETQVLRDYCVASTRLKTAIDFHSYSQLVMSPWGYTSALPSQPDAAVFNQLTGSIRDAISFSGGATYAAGPIFATIYPASGVAVDWWYGARGVYGLTIELRDTGANGFELPPEQIVPVGEENFAGIKALADYFMPVRFAYPTPLPLTPGVSTAVQVEINPGSGWSIAPGTEKLYTRLGSSGVYQSALLSPLGNNTYAGTLPAASCGTPVQFYFEAAAAGGPTLQSPSAAAPLSAFAFQQAVAFADDMETDRGWSVENGPLLTSGAWERGDPVGTFNLNNDMANPEDDATPAPGVRCFATQNGAPGAAAGLTDVDGGPTRLVSPPIDLSGAAAALIRYSRWVYSANGTADALVVEVSSNGTTWVELERTLTTGGWKQATFYLPAAVPPTSTFRLRFSLTDDPNDSLAEAAIDDVSVIALACASPCYANCDGTGGLTANDFQCFLDAFVAGSAYANCDATGGLTANDFQCFLNAFVSGCP